MFEQFFETLSALAYLAIAGIVFTLVVATSVDPAWTATALSLSTPESSSTHQ